MIVCIPTEGERGFDEVVAPGVADASTFTLFDSSTNQIRVVAKTTPTEGNGSGIGRHLPNEEMEALITKAMDRKAVEHLRDKGIEVYVGASGTVSDTLTSWRRGRLHRHQ